ncbi:uncharacterized protein KQ657_002056 [Scheffersomyces spartinae]|uniref:Uncharacterized protein n=1 Tax=Scheffersomyces spartinae TaxID=45513 RepID=A0A9P8AJQ3_9ASCO|nr:uncharacterized protein KQ657_002056 [Scheffersomyces spartinae]KAG7195675.1 hypothetical protein KQ657_002056 [Scheffersomyces spartinae]
MENISPALYESDVSSLRQSHLDEDLENPLLSNVLHAYINTTQHSDEDDEDNQQQQQHYVAAVVAKAAAEYPQQTQWDNDDHDDPQPQSQSGIIKLVQYDPDKKTKRLGRPRKNIKHNLSAPENSSSDNFNEARYAKFRFDNKPILGPGSRGGKTGTKRSTAKGKLTINKVRERQLQTTLSFDNKIGLVLSPPNDDAMDPNLIDHIDNSARVADAATTTAATVTAHKQVTSTVTPIYKRSMVAGASRTSFIRSRRNAKTNSTLLSPLHYELYDDRLIESSTYATNESKLPLAFGFPLFPSPYAKDILYLQMFLTKFKDIIHVGYLGPQDFEDGLGLANVKPQHVPESEPSINVCIRPPSEDLSEELAFNDTAVKKMELLLFKLLSLILNRKKEVTSLLRASAELKSRFDSIAGLPFNPFLLPQFDTLGLTAIPNQQDRLVFLRILAQWSLTSSELIRTYIADSYEGYGDSEYVSRYVQSFGLLSPHDSNYSSAHITKEIYQDQSSLRILDFFAGDCGLHVGRFFLSRMADAKAGGLSSIRNMESAIHRKGIDIGESSSFKLYVQDVHKMLTESLTSFGVEFDEHGNEIVDDKTVQTVNDNYWYEVASNTKELTVFLEFLSKQLRFPDHPIPIRSSSKFYDSGTNLWSYLSAMLPLLLCHEELQGNNLNRRKRKDVNYNELSSVRKTYDSGESDFEMDLRMADNGGSDYSGGEEDEDEDDDN